MTPSIKQEVGYITKYATPAEQERATATDNIQKTFGEDGTCKSRDMIADRQTRSSRYFTSHTRGKVISADH